MNGDRHRDGGASVAIAVARASRTDDYLEAIGRAGAEPLVIDATTEHWASLWARVSGIVLPGGPDVDPRLYGEAPGPAFEPAGHARDAFEIELATRAIERDTPLLAICRGMQVVNVAAGGTLVQHIPDDVPRALDHQIRTPPWAIAHDVMVAPRSRLASALGAPDAREALRIGVNSRHHQAVKHVASGFAVVATADDGVIEAIERPTSRFCLAVQWHPENFWRTGEFSRLFRAFVDACRDR
jgi:putative glutamine amidotransferase